MLEGVPADERFDICAGNMIRLYRLPHDARSVS
jgi:hypothetical protein